MRHQDFIIGGLIIATNKPIANPFAVRLVGPDAVSGWDTPPEIGRVTVERMVSDGTISSRNANYLGKEFTVNLFAKFPETSNIRAFRSNLNSIAVRKNVYTACDMVYYQNDIEVFRERMMVLPGSPFFDKWDPLLNSVEVSLNFYADDPYKTVFQNGSKTPEAQKRI